MSIAPTPRANYLRTCAVLKAQEITQAQIEAVRKELLGWVRIPADAAWDMEYVARRVLAAALKEKP